jgi:hypothetical protein
MNELELLQVLHTKTLTDEVGNRHLLAVPITQSVTGEQKAAFTGEKKIALKFKGEVYAVINEPVFFENRKEEIITRTFGTFSTKHPMATLMIA